MLAAQAAVYARAMQISEPAAPFLRHPDWLVPDWPLPPSVRALCTTRAGGVSQSPYDSMNLGAYVGDAPQAVARNVQRLMQALDARPVMLKQVHGTHLLALDTQSPDYQEADGSYTGQPGLACTVGIADCLPILLCHVADGQATQVGALHAGWRGLAGEQGLGVVEAFFASQAATGRLPAQWLAWLGPCIGPQVFEVGPEVRAAFMAFSPQAAQAFLPLAGGKFLADLPLLARQRLAASGVQAVFGNDGSPAWCTVGNPSSFFSYRRDKVTGRQVASICLL
jgi:YfiH family protein